MRVGGYRGRKGVRGRNKQDLKATADGGCCYGVGLECLCVQMVIQIGPSATRSDKPDLELADMDLVYPGLASVGVTQ